MCVSQEHVHWVGLVGDPTSDHPGPVKEPFEIRAHGGPQLAGHPLADNIKPALESTNATSFCGPLGKRRVSMEWSLRSGKLILNSWSSSELRPDEMKWPSPPKYRLDSRRCLSSLELRVELPSCMSLSPSSTDAACGESTVQGRCCLHSSTPPRRALLVACLGEVLWSTHTEFERKRSQLWEPK